MSDLREVPWDMPTPLAEWSAHGLTCVVLNGPASIDGYVLIPRAHPWHRLGYSECPVDCEEDWCDHTPKMTIDVHGGITFSQLGEGGTWIFGFDTAHAGDQVSFGSFVHSGVLWHQEMVADETERMAAQLAAISKATETE